MDPKTHHINLGSKIYKESFTISWCIKGFNKMPFLEDHPVCGPWFTLGKKRQSTWSLLMTKQIHHRVKNVGFKLVRAEDETMWDVVEFGIGLRTDDGCFVNLKQKQVVGKESSNPYIFILCPSSETGTVDVPSDVKVCKDSEVSVKESANLKKPLALIESSGSKGSTNIGNSSCTDESYLVNGTTVENGRSYEEPSVVNGTTVANGRSSGQSSGVNGTTVHNVCCSEESLAVNGTTAVENGCCSKESAGEKLTEGLVPQPRILSECASLLGLREKPEKLRQTHLQENGHVSESLVSMNGLTNVENPSTSNRSKNVEIIQTLRVSTELPKQTGKSDILHLTPEEFFQKENITVVCKIEYTYMMNDPIPYEEKSNHFDMETFGDLYVSGKFSDITLKCEGVPLPCHKAILCTRSQLFRDFIEKHPALNLGKGGPTPDPVLELNLDYFTAKAILLYMYTDEFDEVIERVDECRRLLKAAGQFGLPGLEKYCLAFLSELGYEDECVFEKESETGLDQKFSLLSICSVDDDHYSVEKY